MDEEIYFLRDQIDRLNSANPNERRSSGRDPWLLAIYAQNKEWNAGMGRIRSLVDLLSDGDAVVRQKAAGAMENLSATINATARWGLALDIQCKERIVEAGRIRPLVDLLSDGDTKVRRQAVRALSSLAEDHPQNQERIVEAGRIRPLVDLLSDGDTVVRQRAAELLSKIIVHGGISFDTSLLPRITARFEAETDKHIKTILGRMIEKCQSRNHEQLETTPGVYVASASKRKSRTCEVDVKVAPVEEQPSCETVQLSLLAPAAPQCVQSASPVSTVVSIMKVEESQVRLGRLLGEGKSGRVYEADYAHQKVAVKKYVGAQIRRKDFDGIYAEILLMQQLDQKYLVRLLGIIETPGVPPSLVMEYGEKGSLYEYLGGTEEIPWGWRLRAAEELARGLAYLHGKNILHRDIKSLNVVLDEDLHVKWCDFGLSLLKEHATASQTHQAQAVGTTRWMAPELFEDEPPETKKSDIWSYGMVLFELATQSIPYKKLNNDQVVRRLIQHKSETVPEECQTRVPRFAGLMESCWSVWRARPEASELVGVLSELRSGFAEPGVDRNVPELASDFIGLSMK